MYLKPNTQYRVTRDNNRYENGASRFYETGDIVTTVNAYGGNGNLLDMDGETQVNGLTVFGNNQGYLLPDALEPVEPVEPERVNNTSLDAAIVALGLNVTSDQIGAALDLATKIMEARNAL